MISNMKENEMLHAGFKFVYRLNATWYTTSFKIILQK
jgi:hypothetical protein